MNNCKLKPTWLELKQAGFIYYSQALNKEVIHYDTLAELVRILREDYNVKLSMHQITHQQEITQDEYGNVQPIIEEQFSIDTYEQSATAEEIKQRIMMKVKNRS